MRLFIHLEIGKSYMSIFLHFGVSIREYWKKDYPKTIILHIYQKSIDIKKNLFSLNNQQVSYSNIDITM